MRLIKSYQCGIAAWQQRDIIAIVHSTKDSKLIQSKQSLTGILTRVITFGVGTFGADYKICLQMHCKKPWINIAAFSNEVTIGTVQFDQTKELTLH